MSPWFQIRAADPEPVSGIDPDDRAFQYGDGLFETVAIRAGNPRLWDYHMDRLGAGCERLGLQGPDADGLRAQLQSALSSSGEDTNSCIAKIVVTAGTSQRGYGRTMPAVGATFIAISESAPLKKSAYLHGVATMLCETRLAVGTPLAGLKTLNRLEQVLARSECMSSGVFEGLTLDTEERLVCGTMSNVFIVLDQTIKTPSLERCGVAGTMRRHVVDRLQQQDTSVEVCDLTEDDLVHADEVFITNSQAGAVPVHRCGSNSWSVGEVTRSVMASLADAGIEECRV